MVCQKLQRTDVVPLRDDIVGNQIKTDDIPPKDVIRRIFKQKP